MTGTCCCRRGTFSIAGGRVREVQWRVLLPDGEVRWVRAHMQAERDKGWWLKRVAGVIAEAEEPVAMAEEPEAEEPEAEEPTAEMPSAEEPEAEETRGGGRGGGGVHHGR